MTEVIHEHCTNNSNHYAKILIEFQVDPLSDCRIVVDKTLCGRAGGQATENLRTADTFLICHDHDKIAQYNVKTRGMRKPHNSRLFMISQHSWS